MGRKKILAKVKNYKELCEFFDKKACSSGKDKEKQLLDLERYGDFKKDSKGYGYTIYSKYKEIKPKEKKKRTRVYKNYKCFEIKKEDYNSIGVYIIRDYDSNDVYIGSTAVGFRRRMQQHTADWNTMEYTKELIRRENSKFEILEKMDGATEEEIRTREEEYIKLYLQDSKYNVINKNEFTKIKGQNKEKKLTIGIEDEKYLEVVNLLVSNNLLKSIVRK